jgi:hypothetical protein
MAVDGLRSNEIRARRAPGQLPENTSNRLAGMKSAAQVGWDAQGSTPQDWHSVGLQNLRRITKGIWQNGHRQYMRKPQCVQNRMESETAQSTRSRERIQSALEQIAKFAIRVPPADGVARTPADLLPEYDTGRILSSRNDTRTRCVHYAAARMRESTRYRTLHTATTTVRRKC